MPPSISAGGHADGVGANLRAAGGKTKPSPGQRESMALEQRIQLLDALAANGEGSAVEIFGATAVSFWVSAPADLDVPGGDTFTVTLHISHDGVTFVPGERSEEAPGTTTLELTQADMVQDGSGRYLAAIHTSSPVYHSVKAVLTNFNDASDSGTAPVADLDVSAFLTIAEK